MHRSLAWLRRRWLAQVQRARDTGALAILLKVPLGCPILSDELDRVAAELGLRVLSGGAHEAGHPFFIGGPLCDA